MEITSDGHVTGFVRNNADGRTDAGFVVDSLKVVKPGVSPRTVFAIDDDGNTYILGKLVADSIETNMLKLNTAVVPAFAALGSPITGSGGPSSGDASIGGGGASGGGVSP